MITALIGFVAIAIAVFGRALIPPSGQMIFGDDIHRQYVFMREFFNKSIAQGEFPWWNPYLFSGEPFIANPVVNIWYPPNWLFSVVPLNIAYSWHLLLHVVWAMAGMYLLLRGVLGKGNGQQNPGAWVGGVVFGLSGFFMARTFAGHVDVIAAASWIPWVVWAFHTLFPAGPAHVGRRVCIAAGIFAMQLLSGYQTMAFFTVIAVGILAAVTGMVERSMRPIARAGLAGLGGVGLAAIHLLPVSEFFRASIRTYSFPYDWNAYGALEWRSLVQFLNPFQFGNQVTYAGPPPNFIEHSAYVGIGGLVLALIGVGYSARGLLKKNKAAVVLGSSFFGIALFGIWASLGPNAPVDLQYVLWKIVPMYHYLRIPPRHLILVVFGLSGLAGIGLSFLDKSLGLPKVLRVLIAGAIVGEMVLFARNFIELKTVPQTRHDSGLIAQLTSDREPYRSLQNFGVWLSQRDVLDFDSTASYGIYSATGYDPSILRPYFEYISRATGVSGEKAVLSHDVQIPYLSPQSAEALDRLNIKYIMVPQTHDPFMGNARYAPLRDDHEDKYRLYENTTVLPRFYLSDRSCGTVSVDKFTANRVELSVDSKCDATLMSSEVWYPGWVATVDNKKVRINKENDVFRTLFVPSGKHTIVYRYVPRIFVIGGLISMLTLAVLGYVWKFRGVRPANIS